MSEQPAQYNAADPAHLKSRKRKEDRERLKREEAERWVMSDPRGRLFVWWVLSECGLFRQSFTGNSETFFLEGKRAIGLKLTAELEERLPKEFLLMWQEHLAEKEKAAKEDEAARTPQEGKTGNGATSDNAA